METSGKRRFGDLPFCLFWTFFSGLIAHGFAYFNAAFSHDGLYQLAATDDLFQVSLGGFCSPRGASSAAASARPGCWAR